MNTDDLSKIKKVEAPPYLFTRILQKIEKKQAEIMPAKTGWTMGAAFILVLALNLGSILLNVAKKNASQNYAQAIHLLTDNELYK